MYAIKQKKIRVINSDDRFSKFNYESLPGATQLM